MGGSAPEWSGERSKTMPSYDTTRLPPAQRVTAAILSTLQRGVRPWRQPWDGGAAGVLPLRANGTPYRGMNVVALWAAAIEAGYASPFWFTFKQALAHGGQVRKGEHGAFVIFYKPLTDAKAATPTDDEGEAQPGGAVLRGYVVFNRAQIDGLDGRFDPHAPAPLVGPDAHARRFAKVPAKVQHGGGRAFYAPSTDHVQMPPLGAFRGLEHYYATLAHEFGHWTRHPSRLNRDVAGMIQYKHASVAAFEGYAGSSRSGFRAEIARERALGQLDDIMTYFDAHQDGLSLSGPASKRVKHSLDTAAAELSPLPGAVADRARLRTLLKDLARTLHVGPLADCFFDPAHALCLKRATDTERDAPAMALCEPTRCPNACFTARHRPIWARARDDATAMLKEKRLSSAQRTILRSNARRYQGVIGDIDGAA
jgi:antirestriction protein ArdC